MKQIVTLFSLVLFLYTFAFSQSAIELSHEVMNSQIATPEVGELQRSVLNNKSGQRGTDTIANAMAYAGGARVCETTASDGNDYRYITYVGQYGFTFGVGANVRENTAGVKTDSIVNIEVGLPMKNCGITTVDGMGFIVPRIEGGAGGAGKIWGNLYSDVAGTMWVDSTKHITISQIDTAGPFFNITWLEFDPPIAVTGDFMLSLHVQPTISGDTFPMLSTGFGCGADSFFTRPRIKVTSFDPAAGAMATPGSGLLGWDETWTVFPNPSEVSFYVSCDRTVNDAIADDMATMNAMGMQIANIDVPVLNNDDFCDVTDYFWLSAPNRSWFRGDDFITVTQPTSGNATALVLDNGATQYGTLTSLNGTDMYTYTVLSPLENTTTTANVTITTTNAFMVGIDEEELNNSVNFYPNPVVSNINFDVDFSEASNVTIEIFNVIGENLIAEDYTNVRNDKLSIDMSSYSEGAYFANITVDGATITKKFVVSK